MENVRLWFDSGVTSLSVRRFRIEESLSGLFSVRLLVRSEDEGIDLGLLSGRRAEVRVLGGAGAFAALERVYGGRCVHARMTRAEDSSKGLSTYEVLVVPDLWLTTQRRDNRLFQHVSIPDIVDVVLARWGIQPTWKIDRARHPPLELRVQFGETDFAFFSRLLEEAGITFRFEDDPVNGTSLVLDERPQAAEARPGLPIPFFDDTSQVDVHAKEHVTAVQIDEDVRPGSVTVRDHDFWRPSFPLFGVASADSEQALEQYLYSPGSFLHEAPRVAGAAGIPGATPVADDRGTARFSAPFGADLAARALEALRTGKKRVTFSTNLLDVKPGVVFSIAGHPRPDLGPGQRLLCTSLVIEGEIASAEAWKVTGQGVFASEPYRPAQTTPKPRIFGLHSAVVVGPRPPPGGPGGPSQEEIYTDEHGRVRVQFHWDREGKHDGASSIWMRVSQGWAGAGYGMFTVPRVGHEVLVAFLSGDPDCPLVVGRAHNQQAQVPYKLPENRTVSTWKSASSPGGNGFNELRFEDAAAREHVYLQAQKDMDHLVKNDLKQAVGNDRTRFVQRDEAVAIGHDRRKVVQHNETLVTGLSSSSTIGLNRVTTVGVEDSTLVGTRWSVTVARGLTSRLSRGLSSLLDGPLAAVTRSAADSMLGVLPKMPLGGLETVAEAALSGLGAAAKEHLGDVLSVLRGFETDPGPSPTSIEMVDRQIKLTTGEASIILDGPNVTIEAQGNIVFHAMKSVTGLGEEELALAGRRGAALISATGDVIVQASKDVHLNPFTSQSKVPPEVRKLDGGVPTPAPRCRHCGSPMVEGPRGLECSQIEDDAETPPAGAPAAPEEEETT